MEMQSIGDKRRETILNMMRTSQVPLSGTALGKATGVSRQVVVQDIALLRTEGHAILATPRGYILEGPKGITRLIKVCHTEEETEEELNLIVDLGGRVEDVIVNHRAYGVISAPLEVRCRRDVQKFKDQILSGKSTLLMNVTSGYHFHHVSADSEEILEEIQEKLKERGFLAEFLPYERGMIG